MATRVSAGDMVQTPFGKGVVREVRNNGRLLVDVHGRALLLRDADVSGLADHKGPRRNRGNSERRNPGESINQNPEDAARAFMARGNSLAEIDLHGLTVDEALARVEDALNDALLADRSELRLIHGRSGGKIRGALHRRLKEIPTVRAFSIDPHNDGVTIVRL